MSEIVTILSTKKLSPTAKAKLLQHNFNVDEYAFISFKYVVSIENASRINVCNEVIIFTSANAVKAYIENVQHFFISPSIKKVYCLSGQTALAAQQLTNCSIVGMADDAVALASLIAENAHANAVTFFCGDHRRDELPKILRNINVMVDEVILYESILTPHTISNVVNALLFFSPTAIDSYLINNNIATTTICFCIGKTTAQYLQSKNHQNIITAAAPTQAAVVSSVLKYYNKKEQAL